jgi:P-type Mg2+ transporter
MTKRKRISKKLPEEFCHIPIKELLKKLGANPIEGLSHAEAQSRLKEYEKNVLQMKKKFKALRLLLSQFNTPFVYLLLIAICLAIFLADMTDALIILGILIVSAILSFTQQKSALQSVEELQKMVQIKVNVIRDKKKKVISIHEVVPGDIIDLSAGNIVPADCALIEANNLLVNESTLTGESFSVEKGPGKVPKETSIGKRTNSLFMGTNIVSGTAKAVAVLTGKQTTFGKISQQLEKKVQKTEFDQGVISFGYFLLKITVIFLFFIFAVNVYLGKPFVESLLFALTLSVGFTPQLLPAIISINLAHGAKKMAQVRVIVKKLSSIENFGSMNILCCDKTGTLTTGKIVLEKTLDAEGNESEAVFLCAYLNACNQSSYTNPLDQAILKYKKMDVTGWVKLEEIPYNFEKKRISVLIKKGTDKLLITKGAFQQVFEICSQVEIRGKVVPIEKTGDELKQKYEEFNNKGFRVLGIAIKNHHSPAKKKEAEMIFLGFLLFFDPPKEDITKNILNMNKLGISLKIITGDNQFAAKHTAKLLGISSKEILLGSEVANFEDDDLCKAVEGKEIFAEIEPSQKERILLALRKNGHVVGYLGDGINDVTALHASDVSISVDTGADAAKEVADIVMLEKDLSVLQAGVKEGRKTFANTLKYILMATSANFGNMFSMAGASLFLSFLPLLPKQVMLTNLMTDFPEMTIATDRVDRIFVKKPLRWNIHFIRKFMCLFGVISSVFDYATFGLLLFIFKSSVDQFRTAWFIESVVSATMIVLVIRTFSPFFKSMPSKYLLMTVIFVILCTVILPFTPFAKYLGLIPLSYEYFASIFIIVILYVLSVELVKKIFLRRWWINDTKTKKIAQSSKV